MMFEIYQLKTALDVVDDLDDDDVDVQPRPPTPPKILDENKVMEKLKSLEAHNKYQRRYSTNNNRSVTLVDANTEMMLTERDVLTSLIESDIKPDDAQKIYRKMFSKSKDFSNGISDLVCTRTSQSSVSVTGSVNGLDKANEQEKSSTTQDLITQEDKDVQV